MIYFIQAGENGPIKIGYTQYQDVASKRLIALQISCPYKLNLLAKIEGGMILEKRLHMMFKKHWMRGEWFRPDREIFDIIDMGRVGDISKLVENEYRDKFLRDKVKESDVWRSKYITTRQEDTDGNH